MEISFVIISNGKKPDKIKNQIISILNLEIPSSSFEIVIAGIYDNSIVNSNIKYVEDSYNALRGSLGGLRNSACEKCNYENIVISDDDMLFPLEWYGQFCKSEKFEILTTRILNPDGTRFWDHACYMSPVKGHRILNPDETDNFLYMSGGQSWIMKKNVWEKVKWDPELLFYTVKSWKDTSEGKHNEDTLFSLNCREAGFNVSHDHNVIVIHDDITYTALGRRVVRRRMWEDPKWVKKIPFSEDESFYIASTLFKKGHEAEAMDIIRWYRLLGNYQAMQFFDDIENSNGGSLVDSNFKLND